MKHLIQLAIFTILMLCGSTAFAEGNNSSPPPTTPAPVNDPANLPPAQVTQPAALIPFRRFVRKGVSEMRDYVPGEDMAGISMSAQDIAAGSPKEGDMIARNPKDPKDLWLVAAAYFAENLEPEPDNRTAATVAEKSLGVTSIADAAAKISDIVVVGNGDLFQLLCKASSKSQGWMKSAKAMEVPGGCVVQVTTQQKAVNGSVGIADAVCFIPEVKLAPDENGGRKLVHFRA